MLGDFMSGSTRARRTGDRLVGFNTGAGSAVRFDLKFVAQRCFLHGLDISSLRDGRFWSEVFVDILDAWNLGDRTQFITLDLLARYFGFSGKNGNGADFAKKFYGDRLAALNYLGNDLLQTEQVAGRVGLGNAAASSEGEDVFGQAAA